MTVVFAGLGLGLAQDAFTEAVDRFLKVIADDRILWNTTKASTEKAVCAALDAEDPHTMRLVMAGFVSDNFQWLTQGLRQAAADLHRAAQALVEAQHSCPGCGAPNDNGSNDRCNGCS